MNEQLQNALADLLTKANNGIEAGADFLTAELPDVIQQLLMWYGVYNFILFIIGFTVITAYLSICCKAIKEGGNHESIFGTKLTGDSGATFGVLALSGVPIILVSSGAINLTWLKIWIAPKIWLIEYAATLAK